MNSILKTCSCGHIHNMVKLSSSTSAFVTIGYISLLEKLKRLPTATTKNALKCCVLSCIHYTT